MTECFNCGAETGTHVACPHCGVGAHMQAAWATLTGQSGAAAREPTSAEVRSIADAAAQAQPIPRDPGGVFDDGRPAWGTKVGKRDRARLELARYIRARVGESATVLVAVCGPYAMQTANRRTWLELQARAERLAGPVATACAPGWLDLIAELGRAHVKIASSVPNALDGLLEIGHRPIVLAMAQTPGEVFEHAAIRGVEVRRCPCR